MMELLIFMATLVYRYDFKLVNDKVEELDVDEGFLRKVRLPKSCFRFPADFSSTNSLVDV